MLQKKQKHPYRVIWFLLKILCNFSALLNFPQYVIHSGGAASGTASGYKKSRFLRLFFQKKMKSNLFFLVVALLSMAGNVVSSSSNYCRTAAEKYACSVSGKVCDRNNCVNPLPEGARCDRASQCESKKCQQTSSSGYRKVCVGKLAECNNFSDCDKHFMCFKGKCVPYSTSQFTATPSISLTYT